jgi:dipeptidyl aminopeptidase/acylaminoacyl peptidase
LLLTMAKHVYILAVVMFGLFLGTLAVFDAHALQSLNRFSGFAATSTSAVYAVKHWDEASDKSTTNLQIIYNNNTEDTLTMPPVGKSDYNPVLSPGSDVVAFLSTRSGSTQIWMIGLDGAGDTPAQLTDLPVDIDNLKWSPNGDYLLFTARVYVDCPDLNCTAQRDAEIAARGSNTGFIFTKLFVRHWDVYDDGKVSHIFRLDLSEVTAHREVALPADKILRRVGRSAPISAPVDLLQGLRLNSPVPPFGGLEQFDISPDSSEIAFTAAVDDNQEAWNTSWRVYTVDAYNPVHINWISQPYKARAQNPVYSHDGTTIAYLTMDRPGFEADRLHITLFNRIKQTNRRICDSWDRSPESVAWSIDDSSLYADADDDGNHALFLINISNQTATRVLTNGNWHGQVAMASILGYDAVVLLMDSWSATTDMYTVAISSTGEVQGPEQLTFLNHNLASKYSFPEGESFYFQGWNGSQVQGWIWRPNGNAQDVPLAVLIHGGPQGSWNNDWSYRWNPQLYLARGYGVVTINPHGSTGFGQAFTDRVSGDWGGAPFQDIMRGVDFVLKNYDWVDPSNVCALGASYGGFMINWIAGQTDRFRCLVTHDGLFDTRAGFFETDELWFPTWEFGSLPWVNMTGFEQFNPSLYVANWKTPMLVIHGGRDYRLPITQGLGVFTALQRQGIPSKMLFFPEENHWVLRPKNSIMWYDTVLSWLDQWTA